MFTGLKRPLSAVRAFYKVRELRAEGCKNVTLQDASTGEEIADVQSLMRDTPYA
jgi:hypothetical protein